MIVFDVWFAISLNCVVANYLGSSPVQFARNYSIIGTYENIPYTIEYKPAPEFNILVYMPSTTLINNNFGLLNFGH